MKKLALVLVALSVSAVLFACGGDDKQSNSPPPAGSASSAPAPAPSGS